MGCGQPWYSSYIRFASSGYEWELCHSDHKRRYYTASAGYAPPANDWKVINDDVLSTAPTLTYPCFCQDKGPKYRETVATLDNVAGLLPVIAERIMSWLQCPDCEGYRVTDAELAEYRTAPEDRRRLKSYIKLLDERFGRHVASVDSH